MKILQNNFTTIEHSKRLLALGVPANSADCIYVRFSKKINLVVNLERMLSVKIHMNISIFIILVGRLVG